MQPKMFKTLSRLEFTGYLKIPVIVKVGNYTSWPVKACKKNWSP